MSAGPKTKIKQTRGEREFSRENKLQTQLARGEKTKKKKREEKKNSKSSPLAIQEKVHTTLTFTKIFCLKKFLNFFFF